MTTTHLLYLHGFRSSPQSAKAQQMAAHVAARHPGVHWWCPQLPPSPRAAAQLILEGTAGWPRATTAVIGSSLGGFYASWFAQQRCCPSVLINPAVFPARDLQRHIGAQTAWHDPQQAFFFRPEYIDELQALDTRALPPAGPQLAFIAQDDEVLDWREMVARYAQAQIALQAHGGHALSDFATHLDRISRFLNLK